MYIHLYMFIVDLKIHIHIVLFTSHLWRQAEQLAVFFSISDLLAELPTGLGTSVVLYNVTTYWSSHLSIFTYAYATYVT